MAKFMVLALFVILGVLSRDTHAADADPLQDFCIADDSSAINVNGASCKSPTNASTEDFTSRSLRNLQVLYTPNAFRASPVALPQLPALNTQGLSVNRVDLGPGGVNTPHVHPRATELIYIMQGTIEAGFVDTNNKLFIQTLQMGDLFLIPRGVVHFQHNIGDVPAVIFATFNSQNPGVERLQVTLFGTGIPDAVLAQSFQLNQSVISDLKQKFTPS